MQVQLDSEHKFPFNLYHYGANGTGQQRFQTGFNVYPGDLDYDYFWFHFQLDMPEEFLPKGEVVYQWATFKDLDDEAAPIYSIGCQTTVGSPDDTKIELFNGLESMSNDSDFIRNRSWDDQNAENTFYGHAYQPMGNPAVYDLRPSQDFSETNVAQSCFAVINIDNKVNREQHYEDGQRIFNRRYEATFGGRLYASDTSRVFIGLPENQFTWRFGEPNYVYPEPVVTEKEKEEEQLATPVKIDDSANMLSVAVGTILAGASLLAF